MKESFKSVNNWRGSRVTYTQKTYRRHEYPRLFSSKLKINYDVKSSQVQVTSYLDILLYRNQLRHGRIKRLMTSNVIKIALNSHLHGRVYRDDSAHPRHGNCHKMTIILPTYR